jgi:hypothetical protein
MASLSTQTYDGNLEMVRASGAYVEKQPITFDKSGIFNMQS